MYQKTKQNIFKGCIGLYCCIERSQAEKTSHFKDNKNVQLKRTNCAKNVTGANTNIDFSLSGVG